MNARDRISRENSSSVGKKIRTLVLVLGAGSFLAYLVIVLLGVMKEAQQSRNFDCLSMAKSEILKVYGQVGVAHCEQLAEQNDKHSPRQTCLAYPESSIEGWYGIEGVEFCRRVKGELAE